MADVKKDIAEVGTFAREIVAKRLTITTVVSAGLSYLLADHIVSVDLSNRLTSVVAIALNVLAALVGIIWARDAVTPADPALAPTSTSGEALAPVAGTSARAARPTPVAATIADDAAAALAVAPSTDVPAAPASA